MKKNPHLHRIDIDGTACLCPDTCGVMQGLKNITLNPTALLLWNNLDNSTDAASLVNTITPIINMSDKKDTSVLYEDVNAFLDSMKKVGAIIEKEPACENNKKTDRIMPASLSDPLTKHFFIGGINVSISCSSDFKDVLDRLSVGFFRDFDPEKNNTDNTEAEPKISILLHSSESASEAHALPDDNKHGLMFETNELAVYDSGSHIVTKYNSHTFPQVPYVTVSKESGTIAAYVTAMHFCTDIAVLCEELLFALRFPYLLTAARFKRYMLHSSSVLMNGKVYCFSAPSGTGKSTHTEKLCRLYNAKPVNGDLNLIGYDDMHKQFMVYGTPWCGTSGAADPHTYPLGGIFLLKRGAVPQIKSMTNIDKILSVSNRMITPVLCHDALSEKIGFIRELSADPGIDISQLFASLGDESADCSAKHILNP